LARTEAKVGPDHLNTLRAMNNLAKCYADLGRYREALELREKTLPLEKIKLAPDHPEVLTNMYNVANLYGYLHRYADALALHQEVLAVRKAKLSPDNYAVFWSMWGVAEDLVKLDRGAVPIESPPR
jgi:tetratricopeptide (TPR) repeat protein